MIQSGLESSKIYQAAYRAVMAAGKNRTKASAREYAKIGTLSENPVQTKLLMEAAKNDYMTDIKNVPGMFVDVLCRKAFYYKTKLQLSINQNYRKSMKSIEKSLKELHPKTYKQRKKLINNGKVSLQNPTTTTERLDRLSISPEKIHMV